MSYLYTVINDLLCNYQFMPWGKSTKNTQFYCLSVEPVPITIYLKCVLATPVLYNKCVEDSRKRQSKPLLSILAALNIILHGFISTALTICAIFQPLMAGDPDSGSPAKNGLNLLRKTS